jgi:G protein-coupled receptor GPR1
MLIESADYAVLVVAIHSALQIFRPAGSGNPDGLYEYRITCFIIEPPTIIEPPYPPSIAIITGYYCNTTTLRNNVLQLIILFRSVAFV